MKKLLLVIVLTMVPVLAHGATYYVATTGSDSNSCSSARSPSTPKRSMNAGAGCLEAGDTLMVHAGTYAECVSDVIPNGTAGAPITVQAVPVRSAMLQPSTPCTSTMAVWFHHRSYIVFDGFVVDLSAPVRPRHNWVSRGGSTHQVTR